MVKFIFKKIKCEDDGGGADKSSIEDGNIR